MTEFQIREGEFIIDGKPQFFICGEIQYFRIPKKYWETVLDRLLECGCNAVAYYVPWFVHEYEENKYDFTGDIHPDNDLRSWIALTRKKGLMGFLRPGPYVYAETTDLGVPKWFSRSYPDARVKGYRDGTYYDVGEVNFASHNHPDFINAVRNWYREVALEIKKDQAPEGNIVLFQLCNEIPGEDTDDRNPATLGIGKEDGLFPTFLSGKYETLYEMNRCYGSDFKDFKFIEQHQLEESNPILAKEDHLEFYYDHYYPHYFKTLRDIAAACGITVLMTHNAYNPRALSLHYHNHIKNPWLALSVDCYYSLMGQLQMESAAYFCEYGAEYMQNFLKCVPWVAEQECGYWLDTPKVYGPELYIFNIWSMVSGYRGINMYLFASGENRPGMGFYGSDHNWQAPVGSHGEVKENFSHIQRSIRDMQRDESIFREKQRYDIVLGIKNDPGFIWKKAARDSDEMYYVLKSCGFTPRLCDYEKETLAELSRHRCIWIVSDEMMNAAVQEKLNAYMEQGGLLIISGRIPGMDEQGNLCTLLAECLGINAAFLESKEEDQQKMIYEGIEYDIGRSVQEATVKPEYVAAYERNKKPCIVKVPYGKGAACVLFFSPRIRFQSITKAVLKLLGEMNIKPQIENAEQLRVIPKAGGKSVILNLHPVPVKERIQISEREYELKLAPYSYQILSELGGNDDSISKI